MSKLKWLYMNYVAAVEIKKKLKLSLGAEKQMAGTQNSILFFFVCPINFVEKQLTKKI